MQPGSEISEKFWEGGLPGGNGIDMIGVVKEEVTEIGELREMLMTWAPAALVTTGKQALEIIKGGVLTDSEIDATLAMVGASPPPETGGATGALL